MDNAEIAIRQDERRQLAALLRDNAKTLATFSVDKAALLELIAFMLEMPAASERKQLS